MEDNIPVVLFAYARPEYLKRTLDCLKENQIPLLYAFCDGAKTPDLEPKVAEVRKILRAIDWCEVHLVERDENLGLGKSIISGVTEMFKKFEMILVFEDDLICVPGTYKYLCAALRQYRNDKRVMSVTGFNYPLNIPKEITDQPYFDGRSDCLVWGAYGRSWAGMEMSASEMIKLCQERSINIYGYGSSLPEMAKIEKVRNIWAVRFLYLHILKGGLCLRPPYSIVEHIGYGELATNAPVDVWPAPPLKGLPPIPKEWPEAIEHPDCSMLWQEADKPGPRIVPPSLQSRIISKLRNTRNYILNCVEKKIGIKGL